MSAVDYAGRRPCLTSPWTIFLFAVTLLVDCKKASSTTPVADAAPPLSVDVVGCAAVVRHGGLTTCELEGTRTLRVILPSMKRSETLTIRNADITADAGAPLVDDAEARAITVHPNADVVVIEVNKRVATVRVSEARRLPWLDEAKAARAKGDLERAAALATEHVADADPAPAALAKGMLARVALSRGRADEAFPLFREAIARDRDAGRISDAADDSFALAFALHQRSQRYTEARAALDAIGEDVLAVYPEARARDPYYRGVLAGETGDHRRALALLRDAETAARRFAMTRLERNARSAVAIEMQATGRAHASLPILAALEAELEAAPASATPCERAELANNRGWGELLVNEAAAANGEPRTQSPETSLERSLSMMGAQSACTDAYIRGFALANMARASLDKHDAPAAEQYLASARASVKEPRGTERIAWMELEARIHLTRQRPRDALRVLDDALLLARASVLRLEEWSLLALRGDVLAALGKRREAIADLEAAEDVLDDATLLVPLGEGRSAFVGGRRGASARSLVSLLLADGEVREAAAAGRRSQTRVLASVERGLRLERLPAPERAKWEDAVHAFRTARAAIDADAANDWKLPADALKRATIARADRERALRASLESAMSLLTSSSNKTSPAPSLDAIAPGVVEVDLYPDLGGFVAIAVDARGGTSFRVPNPTNVPPEDLGRALLDPLGALADARILRVRAVGPWRAVDVHALPWKGANGEPLITKVAVEYALGGGARAGAEPRAARTMLVIGDPTGDLPGALEEAKASAATLAADTSNVKLLVRDQATSSAVTDALRQADRVHYAGHGVFAGDEGWESSLPLAAGGRLTIGDVLALAPAPRVVVLTGCEAAKSSGDTEGLGLAQAFVVAGSSAVLAPVRKVNDDLAAELASALYRLPSSDPTASIATPLSMTARAAIASLRQKSPNADWAAFRVIVP